MDIKSLLKFKKGLFLPQAIEQNTIHAQFPMMKALSWKQPFAELMFHGKDLETRSWNTQVRGWVLICATKKRYEERDLIYICGEVQCQRILVKLNNSASKEIDGMAIGVGYLSRVQPLLKYINPVQRSFVKKEMLPYLYGFQFQNVMRIKPFLFKGGQKWTNLTEDVISKIELT